MAAALYTAIRIIEGLIIVGLQVRPLSCLARRATPSGDASAENLPSAGSVGLFVLVESDAQFFWPSSTVDLSS